MVTEELLKQIKLRLTELYGERLRGVVLFGSEARGEATSDSDIDILVLLRGPVNFYRESEAMIRELYPLRLQIDRNLDLTPADEEVYRQGKYALYRRVHREAMPI